NNLAIGNDSGSSPYVEAAGSASGGGVYVAGGTATLTNVTLSGNTAQGGNGTAVYVYDGKGSGTYHWDVTPGGFGYGGGLYVAGGTVELHGTSVTGNSALGGAGARHDKLRSSPGLGIGGGVFIEGLGGGLNLDPSAVVYLDAFSK